jgi:hypothetical protein
MPKVRVVLINAALGGASGNTAVYFKALARILAREALVTEAVLADGLTFEALKPEIEAANAIVFGTGTHWDSWSSWLQRFLEEATPSEGTRLWLGKPVACVVTEHSVGGKDVLARLQGVLSTYGCLVPPMSGIVLSRVAQIAGRADPQASQDFWCPDDLKVVARNLLVAAKITAKADWKTWPVDGVDFDERWA